MNWTTSKKTSTLFLHIRSDPDAPHQGSDIDTGAGEQRGFRSSAHRGRSTPRRVFYLHGVAYEVKLSNLRNDIELREQVLPAPDVWETAVDRAGAIFGVSVSKLCNAANVASLAGQVRQQGLDRLKSCRNFCETLTKKLNDFGIAPDEAPRMQTASAALTLLESIAESATDNALIDNPGSGGGSHIRDGHGAIHRRCWGAGTADIGDRVGCLSENRAGDRCRD